MTDYLTVNGKRVAVEPIDRAALYPDERGRAARYRIKIGQRFYRVGYTAVIWQAMSVYRDAQGLEHATLMDEAGRLDKKTLSASVLLDRSQYRLI
jgi:KaiC/GvpD/RAD55 family RecA-like ATPase